MLVALKAENIFRHTAADENSSFDYFLSFLGVFGCVFCRRSFANIAVYFIRKVDTDTQDRNKEKWRPFF